MNDRVIVSGVRTAVGSFGGSLKDISAQDLGALVIKEAVTRAGISPEAVDEVIIGQVGQIAEDGFVGRAVSLKAGLPQETTAYSVNRQCGSGLQAIAEAVMEIQTGQADVCVACGTENISRLPYYIKDARWGARMGHKVFEDGVIDILTWPLGPYHNGVTAENVAEQYHVSREEQDAFALESHRRAVQAIKAGKFKDENRTIRMDVNLDSKVQLNYYFFQVLSPNTKTTSDNSTLTLESVVFCGTGSLWNTSFFWTANWDVQGSDGLYLWEFKSKGSAPSYGHIARCTFSY